MLGTGLVFKPMSRIYIAHNHPILSSCTVNCEPFVHRLSDPPPSLPFPSLYQRFTMSFIGLEQPSHSLAWPSRSLVPTLRDNFQLGTIVVAGAAAQALLTLCIGWLSILPAVVYLAYRLSITYAIKTGLCSNPMLDGVQQTKYAAQFPDSNGEYGADAGRDAICVFVLGTRWNTYALHIADICQHALIYDRPLGLFDPRVKEMGNFFGSMTDELHSTCDPRRYLVRID